MRKLICLFVATAAITGLVLVGGCGVAQKSGPQLAFEEFDRAARSGDYQKVYDLLSGRFKKQLTVEDVKTGLQPPGEIKILEAGESGDTGYVRYETIQDGLTNKVVMLRENGVWKVDELIVESGAPVPPQTGPQSIPEPGQSNPEPSTESSP